MCIIKDINIISSKKVPPNVIKLSYCKKCAYYQLCYAGEVDIDD